MTVITTIRPLELQRQATTSDEYNSKENEIVILSHRTHPERVILEFQGKSITVSADELRRAIVNATNHS